MASKQTNGHRSYRHAQSLYTLHTIFFIGPIRILAKETLPPPMLPNNWEAPGDTCLFQVHVVTVRHLTMNLIQQPPMFKCSHLWHCVN